MFIIPIMPLLFMCAALFRIIAVIGFTGAFILAAAG
jgi:hypothetical protein